MRLQAGSPLLYNCFFTGGVCALIWTGEGYLTQGQAGVHVYMCICVCVSVCVFIQSGGCIIEVSNATDQIVNP